MPHFGVTPDARLLKDVGNLWVSEETPESYNRELLIPDSQIVLSIVCGAPIYTEGADGLRIPLPRVLLVGLQSQPLRLIAEGQAVIIAASFYGWSAWPRWGAAEPIPGTSIIPLGGEWPALGRKVEQALMQRGEAEAVAVLQQILLDQRPTNPAADAVRQAGELIYTACGQLNMRAIADAIALSPSQFERRFRQQTGVLPKTYARLVRFEAATDALLVDPSLRMADLACELGYADQSHLAHEFKALARVTPGQFARAARDRLTVEDEDVFRRTALIQQFSGRA
jgi:AraC-like DNA-binding protein